MQQFNKLTAKAVLFIIVLIVLPTVYVLAGHPPDPGGDAGGAPIDGGISLLVAAGIGYGAKKVRDARRKTKQEEESNNL